MGVSSSAEKKLYKAATPEKPLLSATSDRPPQLVSLEFLDRLGLVPLADWAPSTPNLPAVDAHIRIICASKWQVMVRKVRRQASYCMEARKWLPEDHHPTEVSIVVPAKNLLLEAAEADALTTRGHARAEDVGLSLCTKICCALGTTKRCCTDTEAGSKTSFPSTMRVLGLKRRPDFDNAKVVGLECVAECVVVAVGEVGGRGTRGWRPAERGLTPAEIGIYMRPRPCAPGRAVPDWGAGGWSSGDPFLLQKSLLWTHLNYQEGNATSGR
eukprot:g15050.t1